ncbi:hypothetical protein Tco_1211708 [Tanacetum coccineum]
MKIIKCKSTTDIEDVKKKERIKQKRKGKVYLDSDDELYKTGLSTRSSLQTFSQAAYHILSTSSLRAFVQRMKFGKTLKLHIEVIPANLAWNILSCYNVGNKCLLLNGDRIDITRDLVFEIYGFPKGDLEISFVKRWLFQRTKGNQSVVEYCSTELLKKVDDEHLRLKNFGYDFNNEERFFCENKDSEVDVPKFETNDMLLLENDEENSESDNTLNEPEDVLKNKNEGMDDSENTEDYFMPDVHLDEIEAMFEETEADHLLKEKVVEDKALNTYRRRKFQNEADLVNEKEDNVADIENENEENVLLITE